MMMILFALCGLAIRKPNLFVTFERQKSLFNFCRIWIIIETIFHSRQWSVVDFLPPPPQSPFDLSFSFVTLKVKRAKEPPNQHRLLYVLQRNEGKVNDFVAVAGVVLPLDSYNPDIGYRLKGVNAWQKHAKFWFGVLDSRLVNCTPNVCTCLIVRNKYSRVYTIDFIV